MSDANLRDRVIRLAFEHPEFKADLLGVLGSTMAKFEKGKPADPTQHMTEEQKKVWWEHHEKHKDKFKQAAKAAKLKTPIRLKSGEVIQAGSQVTVEWVPDQPSLTILKVEGRNEPVKVSTLHLHKYLSGFRMPPSRATLEKWDSQGWGGTVTGKSPVEADGWGSDGSPSWFLALGLV